jgi:hypothetical protein
MATASRTSAQQQRPPAKRTDRRLPSSQRGYDRKWRALADAYSAENPLCEHCKKAGLVTPMTEVDHILPFDGLDDPLRLDWDNLQSLCHPCHQQKTAEDQRDTTDTPVVCVVTGAPGSGKSTYVQKHRKQGDFVFDLDCIGAAVGEFGSYSVRPDDVAGVLLDWREALVNAIRRGRLRRRVWLIISNEQEAERVAGMIGPSARVARREIRTDSGGLARPKWQGGGSDFGRSSA